MKNIFYKITILALIAGFSTSCDNELDQVPFDQFGTSQAYITAEDFENGIRGVYSILVQKTFEDGSTAPTIYGGSDAGSMLSTPDILSDNVTLAQAGRNTQFTAHNWNYSAANSILGGLYFYSYELVYRANTLLAFADDFEGESKANIIAEAKALRALANFNLVNFYGKIPTQSGDANSALGIAYVTEPDPVIEPARISVGEVYNNIAIDLADAAANINSDNGPGRMGTDAVNLLLSRVYLYMGQWQNAINAANQVSTPVAPRADVVGVWTDDNKSGVLFNIPNEVGVVDQSAGIVWSQGPPPNLIPEYAASFGLYNLFEDDDIRRDAYTFSGTDTGGNEYNAIKKLFGRGSSFNGKVDFKIFRAAEAQLNIAEAQYNLGNESGARTALDAVRTKRYETPPSGETGNALRDAIRLERRLEFAFEYQRYFDLKRWGLPVTRLSTGEFADGTGTASEQLTLQASSFKFQLPISQASRDTNPNLQQNPGY
ncbi:RagB/SusD family nutrient uptake outer membrane protein [Marixanthomonas ophiurae]|uniref:RagB/SusD family nutrient uptake outer membrane protein n=1 Tax=Marixanthomonas ophiurae TaxID=387659 RepID=A0A3E1Q964_9FLAO|nr:RagB/SusD family nutrient uptake outer membrane protein [Marixanthomonas ophiurae]RFN58676.1 RagB/SusD family nutrient uptake outer membrane protein [Marixanthomonas ophiurae]